jgi:hypothetical protein
MFGKLRVVIPGTAAALVGIAFLGGVALATTTFNPATGTGFVGKGDVQTPWGWNDQTLQSQAINVSFFEVQNADYAATCEWDTGVIHIVNHTITKSVSDTVA